MLLGLIKTMRPRQWAKNIFVFVALFFDRKLTDPESVLRTLAAFVLLCLMSSAVYLMNDLADIENDRQHPDQEKSAFTSRPIKPCCCGHCCGYIGFGQPGLPGSYYRPA